MTTLKPLKGIAVQYTGDADVTKIVEGLGGSLVPDASGNSRCWCPSHPDSRPSLSVRDRDGKALFRCFAGCRQSDVLAALQRLGLMPGRPAPGARATESVQPPRPAQPLWTPDPLKPWREAVPAAAGSLVDVYLRNRWLTLPAGARRFGGCASRAGTGLREGVITRRWSR